MEYKPGTFYDIKWNGKEFKHCEFLEMIPGTNLAAVRTPKYEYFEIHTDYLVPEEIKKEEKEEEIYYSTWQETGLNSEPITLHLDKPLKAETIVNVDTSKFEEVVNTAARSVANEFQGSKKADPLTKQKACKYEKFKELIAMRIQECDKVINDEYALKKNVLKANTIKDALVEIQNIVEG